MVQLFVWFIRGMINVKSYWQTINELTSIRDDLRSKVKEIKNAALISYSDWDSDTRDAYQSIINSITSELYYISNEIESLKTQVYNEDD